MKSLNQLVAIIAAIGVIVFVSSLVMVVSSDGANESAGEVCAYSLVASFVLLIFYKPSESRKELA